MDILDFFWTLYLNHLSPLWGYFITYLLMWGPTHPHIIPVIPTSYLSSPHCPHIPTYCQPPPHGPHVVSVVPTLSPWSPCHPCHTHLVSVIPTLFPYPHLLPNPPLPPRGGTPGISKNSIKLKLIEIF